MRDVAGAVAFVSGGQRGIGRAIARELLERGAVKVYVTARAPSPEQDRRLVPVPLDVTDHDSVLAAALTASDTQLLINNAGAPGARPFTSVDLALVRSVFDTNFFGALDVALAFAPVLARNGGGILVNTLSVLSWLGGAGPYGASKAALWNATNSLRVELRDQGTRVIGVHVGRVATDMTKNVREPMIAPEEVARAILDGIRDDATEVLVDDPTRQAKAALSGPPEGLEL